MNTNRPLPQRGERARSNALSKALRTPQTQTVKKNPKPSSGY
mgnify:FL=1